MAALEFLLLRTNIGLERALPLLLLPTLVLRNLINGGGNFSVRPGLDMGFVDSFIFKQTKKNSLYFSISLSTGLCFFFFLFELCLWKREEMGCLNSYVIAMCGFYLSCVVHLCLCQRDLSYFLLFILFYLIFARMGRIHC